MPEVITFGCRLNSFESEVIRTHLLKAGLKDALVINSCAVTGEAERQTRQAIRKARRDHPDAKIIVTGCAAQVHPDKYAAMPEVDYVIGNDEKLRAETYLALDESKIHITDIRLARATALPLVQGFEGGLTRAFIQVQNGCDNRCTFCLIPFGRGPSRSVPFEAIAAQVRLLVEEKNYPEIALTGVDITSYGKDLPEKPTLGRLVKDLLAAVPALQRLRLSSLDPAFIDEDLWEVIASEPRLMPHLHLSVQAGDDLVLKRMARRHSRQDVIDLCARARRLRPDIVFGADLIAGFPTETDAQFDNTAALVGEAGLTWLHVFPYSARTGTPAARMPQVRGELRKERAARLRALGEAAVMRHIDSLIGQRLAVHVEQSFVARTPTFAEVHLEAQAEVGSVIEVVGTARDGMRLVARKVEA
ncbi:MAG: tRNA (N(6)-L-threonylcarbamoyladenosine(37)-C(2))-methylthiotransferase MtaB [Alphaproteobacteria bacterium]|nr:tRNA (N(6)-L-threonylcarbamoyladenosine(37)-C(2))-methylthiotransferase MtaB [Alphaproteobacteria bacterium]